jgi:hypothetical protein
MTFTPRPPNESLKSTSVRADGRYFVIGRFNSGVQHTALRFLENAVRSGDAS